MIQPCVHVEESLQMAVGAPQQRRDVARKLAGILETIQSPARLLQLHRRLQGVEKSFFRGQLDETGKFFRSHLR